MPDPLASLRQSLKDHYEIERELGRGGMATVHLAHDLRHDRPVALKVLHQDLAASVGAERFLREIRLAARLQHPHILTVLDSGTASPLGGGSDILWFTMPFIRGESLRERLRRETQLPVEDALRITREAADALSHAHGEGVIHRDIKPENILLSGTHALVSDFGIARALGAADEKLTATGLAVGTPAYMSPEQAAGNRELDARTDIYSLAVVLYEMLAGETPFAAPTAQAMVARRFMDTPKPIRQLREAVPEPVEQALQRALARTPADRYASAEQFAAALEVPRGTGAATATQPATVPAPPPSAPTVARTVEPLGEDRSRAKRRSISVAASALMLGILIGLGVLFAWRRNHVGDDSGVRYLAVLPFENVGDASDEYFAEGVTDAVRGKLSSVPGLQVIAGQSSAEYKKSGKSLGQIARELGVSHLVVAKIRWARLADGTSRVQVSPELVQVSSNGTPTVRWQQAFDAAITDVFQVQANVAGRVAQELGIVLADSAKRELGERPTRNLEAYDLFLRAQNAVAGRSDPASLRTASALYRQAIALDSNFALAWARLARVSSTLYANTAPSQAEADLARHAAQRALGLAPGRGYAHAAQAAYYRSIERDNERTLRSLHRARELDPGDAETLGLLAATEADLGRMEAAADLLRQAERLDPRSPQNVASLGRLLFRLRRYEEADSALRRAQALDPGSLQLAQQRVLVAIGRGDLGSVRRLALSPPPEIDRRAFAVHLATYNDLYWVLDSAQQDLVLAAGPDDFDGDVGSWGLALAQIYAARGDGPRARAYADSARAGFAEQVEADPDGGHTLVLHAVSLAYLGRLAEAVREGERAMALQPISESLNFGTYVQELVARIYVMAGQPDKAIERLRTVLAVPSHISRDRLRIDPHFTSLRDHPQFRRLVEGAS